jgi:hypothetical protein
MPISKWSLLLVSSAALLLAQTPPNAYTVVEVNAMFGKSIDMTIYRDGSRAVVDQSYPSPQAGAKPVHIRGFYNLDAHTTQSWDANQPEAGCSNSSFSGDWGDPFAAAAEILKQSPKETGTETVNGASAKVLEAAFPGGTIKAWLEPKSGLVMRAQLTPTGGAAQTIIEIKKYTPGAPPASAFAVPPSCAAAAAAPHVPTEQERIASETGGNAADFANAIMPPASQNSCAADIRVMRAGSMQPMAGGFQIALDTTVNLEHPASYQTGISADGKATFSGGGIREMTSQLRNGVLHIDNLPPYFHVEAHFGKGGDSDALIYRHCFAPSTVLVFVVKNPDRLSDGGDWLWVKSGKFAASAR